MHSYITDNSMITKKLYTCAMEAYYPFNLQFIYASYTKAPPFFKFTFRSQLAT